MVFILYKTIRMPEFKAYPKQVSLLVVRQIVTPVVVCLRARSTPAPESVLWVADRRLPSGATGRRDEQLNGGCVVGAKLGEKVTSEDEED